MGRGVVLGGGLNRRYVLGTDYVRNSTTKKLRSREIYNYDQSGVIK